MTEPLVTVVVTPREGHCRAESSLLSVLADDCIPFDLVYVDFGAPPAVAAALRRLADAHKFRLVEHPSWAPPAVARKSVLGDIKTKYVVFADNDLGVERGCLETLVTCAEETGAGLVCPLYLQAGGGRATTIHMAGGAFVWSDDPEPRLVAEIHRGKDAPLESAAEFKRETVDYTEYHYVLARTDLVQRPGAISDEVLLVHEHLDLALFAREQGRKVVFEPAAKVAYMAFDPRPLSDVPFYRRRWDADACAASLAAFARRWPFVDAEGLIGPMTDYAQVRLQEVSLRRRTSAGEDLAAPMRAEELAQSRLALREQASARGYSAVELGRIEAAGDFATVLFDGLYRPDGRPFLSHALGVASVLVRYELQADLVLAGLLHAALSHRPPWMDEAEAAASLRAEGVETLVRGQPDARAFLAREGLDIGALNMTGAGIAAILAANHVDMLLSGEYRATGRPSDLSPVARERLSRALEGFAIDGLIASAREAPEETDGVPLLGAPWRSSFRLDAKNRKALPV